MYPATQTANLRDGRFDFLKETRPPTLFYLASRLHVMLQPRCQGPCACARHRRSLLGVCPGQQPLPSSCRSHSPHYSSICLAPSRLFAADGCVVVPSAAGPPLTTATGFLKHSSCSACTTSPSLSATASTRYYLSSISVCVCCLVPSSVRRRHIPCCCTWEEVNLPYSSRDRATPSHGATAKGRAAGNKRVANGGE